MELGRLEDGVRVVGICQLLENLFGEDVFKGNGPSYKEQIEKVREWVDKQDAHYYADVKEKFFIWRGVEEAKKKGKTIVVVENLS